MLPKNSGGSSKFPGGQQVIHRIAQTAFVRVVTPRSSKPHDDHQNACLFLLDSDRIIIIYYLEFKNRPKN